MSLEELRKRIKAEGLDDADYIDDGDVAMNEPVLCYVDEPWAYFTTQKLEDQWGDGWDDAPYEHNAGEPYGYSEHDKAEGKKPWQIIKVAYGGIFDTPAWNSNIRYSVEMINSKAVAWLANVWCVNWQCEKAISILAGTTLSDFCRLIREGGGSVYMKVDQ